MSPNNFVKLVYLTVSALIISSCSNSSQDSKSIEIINAHYSPNEASSNIAPAPEQNVDFQMKLWQKGVDFYARGNEPSWSLDMDFGQGFYFKTLLFCAKIIENFAKSMFQVLESIFYTNFGCPKINALCLYARNLTGLGL